MVLIISKPILADVSNEGKCKDWRILSEKINIAI